jgi:hypothetical protein
MYVLPSKKALTRGCCSALFFLRTAEKRMNANYGRSDRVRRPKSLLGAAAWRAARAQQKKGSGASVCWTARAALLAFLWTVPRRIRCGRKDYHGTIRARMHKAEYAGRVGKNAVPLQDGLEWPASGNIVSPSPIFHGRTSVVLGRAGRDLELGRSRLVW